MSLITCCPACGTMFKVVPDQLRISEGWVRCGHCSEVFDASAHLMPDDADLQEPVAQAGPAEAMAPPEAAVESLPAAEEFESSLNTEVGDSELADALDSAQLEAEAQALVEDPRDQPFELRRQDSGEIVLSQPARLEPVSELESEPELHDLSFVRQARSQAFWRRPVVRAALAVLLAVLGLLLVLQVAVHDRDRLAASDPALRPWLERLCAPLRCQVGPPRQIEAIAIDSSTFNKLRGDAYRLNFTLRNHAPMQVAMPALELTLTDGQDQPVVRRVLLPADLGPNPGVLAPAGEWSASIPIAVAANGDGGRIAGYRLLAFYP